MVKIFISYRRADSNEESRQIYEALAERFGEENIFRDKDRIPKGTDFRKTIEQYVFVSDEMLVLIGKKWLDIREDSDSSRRRLDNPEDFVRIEISMGLRHVKHITPVILQNAPMPNENELPRRLVQLGFQNAYFLRPDHFDYDLEMLVEDITQRHNYVDVNSPDVKNKRASVSNQIISTLSTSRIIVASLIIVVILFINLISNMGINSFSTATSTQIIRLIYLSETPTSISANEARETGAAEAYSTLTALAPTNTPTITLTPTNTPISSSDIQNTARAETFSQATLSAQTETAVAQLTQDIVQTEQFVAGATATYIAQLSLTPILTLTPRNAPTSSTHIQNAVIVESNLTAQAETAIAQFTQDAVSIEQSIADATARYVEQLFLTAPPTLTPIITSTPTLTLESNISNTFSLDITTDSVIHDVIRHNYEYGFGVRCSQLKDSFYSSELRTGRQSTYISPNGIWSITYNYIGDFEQGNEVIEIYNTETMGYGFTIERPNNRGWTEFTFSPDQNYFAAFEFALYDLYGRRIVAILPPNRDGSFSDDGSVLAVEDTFVIDVETGETNDLRGLEPRFTLNNNLLVTQFGDTCLIYGSPMNNWLYSGGSVRTMNNVTVNIRRSPSAEADIVGVNQGELMVFSRSPSSDWYKVNTFSELSGWVSASVVEIINIPENLPVED